MDTKEQPDNSQRTLVITGMHRSCTSLVTQWIHTCGLQIGENLLSSSDSNEDGHFEDLEFLHIHEEILQHQGFPVTGLCPLEIVTPTVYDKAKIAAVLAIKNKLYKQWGWKEPRTCLFLNTYKELLPTAKYLVVFRDYHAVVGSLLTREFLPIEKTYLSRNWFKRVGWHWFRKRQRMEEFYNEHSIKFLNIWIAYNKAILNSIGKLDKDEYLIINYEMLKNKSPQVFRFLTSKWNFELNYRGFLTIYKDRLISDRINFMSYIKDPTTIQEADELNQLFNDYLCQSDELLKVQY